MPRLIDAEELELQFDVSDEDIIAKEIIRNAPTVDAVPVVRCRDCEHLVNAVVNVNGFLICGVSDMEITPEDFCSYGERKEKQNGRT